MKRIKAVPGEVMTEEEGMTRIRQHEEEMKARAKGTGIGAAGKGKGKPESSKLKHNPKAKPNARLHPSPC